MNQTFFPLQNYKKQNLSTVLSVASYNPENFQTVIDLFKEYEEKEGPQRNYPQNVSNVP